MSGDVMSVGMTGPSAVANQKCERALTARGNVVVDVRACSPNMNSGGYNIASDIAAKIR
jgi:serine/threonine-protein kinase